MIEGRVVCVIPALDAERTLPGVLRQLRRTLPGALLVGIDDGSRDQTRGVLEASCDVAVAHERNRGKGSALRAGFAAALERGAWAVVTIDADGQHVPAFAPRLLDALDHADLVVGARAHGGSMPLPRRLTNAASRAAVSRCAGCDVPDPQSGFRAIRATVLRAVSPEGDRYEYETELLILAARAGFRLAHVPIPTLYGPPSHFRHLRDGARVIHAIWRHRPGAGR